VLILSAGMERSASTWLYNVIRFLIKESNHYSNDIKFGWIDDISPYIDTMMVSKKSLVIKVHNYDEIIAEKSDLIFYSYRDLRDVLASLKRKFDTKPSFDLAESLIKRDQIWRDVANYSMRYENMLLDKENEIESIAYCLGINDVNPELVLSQINNLSYESSGQKNKIYHKDNLFHKGHITDGREGSWSKELSAEFVAELVINHKEWFNENNYHT
jgi:hypothetical protein